MPRSSPGVLARRGLLAALASLPAACAAAGRGPANPAAPRAAARPAPAPVPPPALRPLDASFRVVRPAKLRRSPSTTAAVLAVLPVGTALRATGRVEGRDWLEVRHGRLRGFVHADLVEAASSGAGGDAAELPAEAPASDAGRP